MKIVFHSDKKNGITDKDTKKDIEKALDNIKQDDDYVQNVSNPYDSHQVNDDKDTAIATVNYVVNQTALQDSSKKIIDRELDDVKADHNLKIEQTQGGSMNSEVGGSSELVGIVTAFIILLIIRLINCSWYANCQCTHRTRLQCWNHRSINIYIRYSKLHTDSSCNDRFSRWNRLLSIYTLQI